MGWSYMGFCENPTVVARVVESARPRTVADWTGDPSPGVAFASRRLPVSIRPVESKPTPAPVVAPPVPVAEPVAEGQWIWVTNLGVHRWGVVVNGVFEPRAEPRVPPPTPPDPVASPPASAPCYYDSAGRRICPGR